MSPQILPAATVEPEELRRFLRTSFPEARVRLLLEHGTWRHRGAEHQMALTDGARVVGYCGVIPTRCRVRDSTHDAVWWVDLVIDPEYRGRGLQTLFDERVRRMTQLKLGFPNALAARIHRKHGWGVREDYETLLLPLRPGRLPTIARTTGVRKLGLRLGMLVLEPATLLLRRRLRHHAGQTESTGAPDPDALADVFERRHPRDQVTTLRDSEHLDWRYRSSPHRRQTRTYTAGGRLAAVARFLDTGATPVVRVLDLFGALDREELLVDLLRAIGRDADEAGAAQVTLFSTLPAVSRAARRAGFRLPGVGRFCWYSADRSVHRSIANSPQHWVLGDSDHDEPE